MSRARYTELAQSNFNQKKENLLASQTNLTTSDGSTAVVGKGFAVLQSGKVHVSGFLALLAWAGVHLQFLAESNLRVSVFLQWVWTYLTGYSAFEIVSAIRDLKIAGAGYEGYGCAACDTLHSGKVFMLRQR